MARNSLLLRIGALLTVASLGVPALAETRTENHENGYDYFFDADNLDSTGTSPYGSWFILRPPRARVTLIRPRTEYVSELLASADDI